MRVNHFVAQDIGDRPEMQDEIVRYENDAYFVSAIFDGHGGKQCSQLLSNNFVNVLKKELREYDYDYKRALLSTCYELQSRIIQQRIDSGSTGNIALVDKSNGRLHVINLGDSRLLFFTERKASQTQDHKPETDKPRLQEMGSKVVSGRVEGQLALSRAFGDFSLANKIIFEPEVYEFQMTNKSWVLHASDGLFDVFKSSDLVKLVRQNYDFNDMHVNLAFLQELVDFASSINGADNVTACLFTIEKSKSSSQKKSKSVYTRVNHGTV